MTKTRELDQPPVCDCCERKVRETSSKPVLIGCDAMLCKDCWYEWYDSGECDPVKLGKRVRDTKGVHGGEANLTEIYERRRKKREDEVKNCIGANI